MSRFEQRPDQHLLDRAPICSCEFSTTKSLFCYIILHFSGEPVAVVHGANAPLLGRMIVSEMYKERRVMSGECERKTISLAEAVPSECTDEMFL